MTGIINWAAYTQSNVNGTVINTQGNNVADGVTVASGGTAKAPEGAMYASVYCDVVSTVSPDFISSPDDKTIFNGKETRFAAGETREIPNVIPGKTTLTVTDV